MGYGTNFPGQGPVTRVIYSTLGGEIHEMSLVG
jgi:hypothetical protein